MTNARRTWLLGIVCAAACSTETARDPAALRLRNYAAPLPGVHTSGQPTEEQFAGLAAAGITRVITLRAADESGTGWEEARAHAAGVQFVRLPVAGRDGLTRATVERFAEALRAGGDAPTLVCCASSNRVGALFALKAAWLDGMPEAEALDLGRAAGMERIEPEVQKLLAAPR